MSTQPVTAKVVQIEETELQLISGRTYSETWQLIQVVNGQETAVDMTGWTFTGSIYKNDSSNTVVASFSFDSTDAANGNIVVSLTKANSELLDSNCEYRYETFYNDGTNEKDFFLGPVNLVTRVVT